MSGDLLAAERSGVAPPYAAVQPVSWSAIFAGAATSLALSIVMTSLAAGFGLTLGFDGIATRASLAVFDPAVGAWMVVIQVLASAFGGYLAGRLRAKWAIHADEAHFRDTAHGLLAWAVATVAGVVLAATVLAPYADHLAGAAAETAQAGVSAAEAAVKAQRDAGIAGQSAFFIGVGLLLSAFTAAVAGALGGVRTEEMAARL